MGNSASEFYGYTTTISVVKGLRISPVYLSRRIQTAAWLWPRGLAPPPIQAIPGDQRAVRPFRLPSESREGHRYCTNKGISMSQRITVKLRAKLTLPVSIPWPRAENTIVPRSYLRYNGLVYNLIQLVPELEKLAYSYSFSGRSRTNMLCIVSVLILRKAMSWNSLVSALFGNRTY